MTRLSPPLAAAVRPALRTRQAPPPVLVALGACLIVGASAQLLSSALPDVQAAIGGGGGGASWVSTAYAGGLLTGVVFATALLRAFGLGAYAAGCAAAFALAAAIAVAAAPDHGLLVALRAVQGFAAGGLGPSAFVAVFSLAGRERLMSGLALLAFVILFPGVLGPALAGPLEAAFGWRGLFAVQALAGAAAAAAAFAWLPRPPFNPAALKADWTALVLLAAGLAALAVVLSQGPRLQWFEDRMFAGVSAIAVLAMSGFAVLVRRRPGAVMDPGLLVRRDFAGPIALLLTVRTASAVPALFAPHLLVSAHGYDARALGGVFLMCAAAQAAALPAAWWLIHRVDGRAVIAGSLVLFAAAAASLSGAAGPGADMALWPPLAAASAAQVVFLVANLQAGASRLAPADGPSATLIFNVASVGGLAVGSAVVSPLLLAAGPAAGSPGVVLLLAGLPLLAGLAILRFAPLPPLVKGVRAAVPAPPAART